MAEVEDELWAAVRAEVRVAKAVTRQEVMQLEVVAFGAVIAVAKASASAQCADAFSATRSAYLFGQGTSTCAHWAVAI